MFSVKNSTKVLKTKKGQNEVSLSLNLKKLRKKADSKKSLLHQERKKIDGKSCIVKIFNAE